MFIVIRGLKAAPWLLLAGALLSACAVAPMQEMSDARQAIAAAREAGAETYATDELGAAEVLLGQAQAALKRGDYDGSREDALRARREAVKARELALELQQETDTQSQ